MKKTKLKKTTYSAPRYLKSIENHLESVAENASWAQLASRDLPDLMNQLSGFSSKLNIRASDDDGVEWNEFLKSDAYTWLSKSHHFVEIAQRATRTASILTNHLVEACSHANLVLEASEKLLKSGKVI